MSRPPFFTWIPEAWTSSDQVPLGVRNHMRVLWLQGERVEAIAQTFGVPAEWVAFFVAEAPPTKH